MRNILNWIFIFISFISCAKDDLSNSSIVGSGIPDSFFVANLEAPSNNKTCERIQYHQQFDLVGITIFVSFYYYLLTNLNTNTYKYLILCSQNYLKPLRVFR